MSRLKAVGYWYDKYGGTDPRLPDPRQLVDTRPDSRKLRKERQAIVKYLKAGIVIGDYLGMTHCRFNSDTLVGENDLSDGVWMWPEGLSHDIEAHRVTLPEEFVEHMQQNKWRVPKEIPPVEAVDYSLWLEWGKDAVPGPDSDFAIHRREFVKKRKDKSRLSSAEGEVFFYLKKAKQFGADDIVVQTAPTYIIEFQTNGVVKNRFMMPEDADPAKLVDALTLLFYLDAPPDEYFALNEGPSYRYSATLKITDGSLSETFFQISVSDNTFKEG